MTTRHIKEIYCPLSMESRCAAMTRRLAVAPFGSPAVTRRPAVHLWPLARKNSVRLHFGCRGQTGHSLGLPRGDRMRRRDVALWTVGQRGRLLKPDLSDCGSCRRDQLALARGRAGKIWNARSSFSHAARSSRSSVRRTLPESSRRPTATASKLSGCL